jgi:molybdate transport system substrate-binding protein
VRALAPLLALALVLPGCGGEPEREPLVVLAAASLTGALGQAERSYEADRDVDLRVSFAGSQVLAAQVREGAPADVLVTADQATSGSVASLLGPPTVVARNQLAIVTAPGDPRGLTSLRSLADPTVRVVLAGPTVPVGRAARQALEAAAVVVRPVSEEPDVRGVVGRVRLGEADAGIAYVTDLRTPGVEGTPVPGTSTSYPASVLLASARQGAARAFVAWLAGREGQAVLRDAGFLPPP